MMVRRYFTDFHLSPQSLYKLSAVATVTDQNHFCRVWLAASLEVLMLLDIKRLSSTTLVVKSDLYLKSNISVGLRGWDMTIEPFVVPVIYLLYQSNVD